MYNQGMPGMYMPGMPGMPKPQFREISRGNGIDCNEYTRIIDCCTTAYQSGSKPISQAATNGIKMALGGEWLVVCYPATRTYDFSLSTVKGGDFMNFALDNIQFQVCRIR